MKVERLKHIIKITSGDKEFILHSGYGLFKLFGWCNVNRIGVEKICIGTSPYNAELKAIRWVKRHYSV